MFFYRNLLNSIRTLLFWKRMLLMILSTILVHYLSLFLAEKYLPLHVNIGYHLISSVIGSCFVLVVLIIQMRKCLHDIHRIYQDRVVRFTSSDMEGFDIDGD